MRRFFELLFGNIGLLISSGISAVVSWFLFPLFVNLVRTEGFLVKIGAIFCGIFAVGFLAASILTAFILIIRFGLKRAWVPLEGQLGQGESS